MTRANCHNTVYSVAPKPACTYKQSDLIATLLYSSVEYGFIDLTADSVALRSDSMDVQVDLELHCL